MYLVVFALNIIAIIGLLFYWHSWTKAFEAEIKLKLLEEQQKNEMLEEKLKIAVEAINQLKKGAK